MDGLRHTINEVFGTGDAQWFNEHNFVVDDFPNNTAWIYFLAIAFVGIILLLLYFIEAGCKKKSDRKKFFELEEHAKHARCDENEKCREKKKGGPQKKRKENKCAEKCQGCCCSECNPITCMQQETGRCLRATDKRCDKTFDHNKCFCPCSENCEELMFCDSNAFLKDPNHRVHNHFIELDLKKKNQDPSKGRYLKAEDRCSLKVFAFFRDHALTRLLFDDGAALFFFAYAIYANVDAYRGFGESFHFRQAVGTVNTLNDAWHLGPIDGFAAANLSAMNAPDLYHSCSNPGPVSTGYCRNHFQCPSGPGWEKVQFAATGRFAGKQKEVVVDMWRNQGFCIHRADRTFSAIARERALQTNPNLTVGEFYSGLPDGLTPLAELTANITESPSRGPADWINESVACYLDQDASLTVNITSCSSWSPLFFDLSVVDASTGSCIYGQKVAGYPNGSDYCPITNPGGISSHECQCATQAEANGGDVKFAEIEKTTKMKKRLRKAGWAGFIIIFCFLLFCGFCLEVEEDGWGCIGGISVGCILFLVLLISGYVNRDLYDLESTSYFVGCGSQVQSVGAYSNMLEPSSGSNWLSSVGMDMGVVGLPAPSPSPPYLALSKTGGSIDITYARLADGLEEKYVSWEDHQTLAQSSTNATAEAGGEVAGEAAGDSIISTSSTVGDGSSVIHVQHRYPITDIRLYSRLIDPETGLVIKNDTRPCEPVRFGTEVGSLTKKGTAKRKLNDQKECRPQTNMVVLDTVPGAVLVEWDREKLVPDETSVNVTKRRFRRAGWVFLALFVPINLCLLLSTEDCGVTIFFCTLHLVLFITFLAIGYTNVDVADDVAPNVCQAIHEPPNGYNFLLQHNKGPIKKQLKLQWYLGYETERDWSSACAINRAEFLLGVDLLENMERAEKVTFSMVKFYFAVVMAAAFFSFIENADKVGYYWDSLISLPKMCSTWLANVKTAKSDWKKARNDLKEVMKDAKKSHDHDQPKIDSAKLEKKRANRAISISICCSCGPEAAEPGAPNADAEKEAAQNRQAKIDKAGNRAPRENLFYAILGIPALALSIYSFILMFASEIVYEERKLGMFNPTNNHSVVDCTSDPGLQLAIVDIMHKLEENQFNGRNMLLFIGSTISLLISFSKLYRMCTKFNEEKAKDKAKNVPFGVCCYAEECVKEDNYPYVLTGLPDPEQKVDKICGIEEDSIGCGCCCCCKKCIKNNRKKEKDAAEQLRKKREGDEGGSAANASDNLIDVEPWPTGFHGQHVITNPVYIDDEVGNDSLLAMLDTNGDGIVDDNELLGGAAAAFDPDGDGISGNHDPSFATKKAD